MKENLCQWEEVQPAEMVSEEAEETGKKEEISAKDKAYARRRKIVSLCSFTVLLAFFAVVTVFVGKPLIEGLEDPEQFRQWVDGHGLWGRLAFIGMICLQVVVAVIPGEPLEIAAGYVFGNLEGVGLCLLGAAAGTADVYKRQP